MELVKLSKTEIIPTTINVNFAEVKQRLLLELDAININVETEEEAKKERAKLNKLITALDDERKLVKKEAEKPIKEFESQVKDLIKLVEEKANYFDNVQKRKEQQRREAKRKQCMEWWGNDATYDTVHQEYWLNVTTTEKRIKEDMFKAMQGKVEEIPFTTSVLDEFEPAESVFIVTVPFTQANNFREYLRIKNYEYSEGAE